MRIVKVEWIDSCASNMEWTILADLEGDIEPIKIFSFGALIQETNDTITIAQNYGINPEQVCSFMTIPKGCIKKITDIEEISQLKEDIEK